MEHFLKLMILFGLGMIWSCQVGENNHYPIIESITADSQEIAILGTTQLHVMASDGDDDVLSYAWENVYAGIITGDGPTFTFEAHGNVGSYRLICWVFDNHGGADRAEVEVTVIRPEMPEGAVAYYPFNGNAYDESGFDNNGILVGLASDYSRFGIWREAYIFSGSNSYINVQDDPSLDITDAISISVWIKPARIGPDNIATILSKQHASTHVDPYSKYGLYLFNHLNAYQFRIGTQNLLFGYVLYDQWQHIVVTFDYSQNLAECWVDGALNNYATHWDQNIEVSNHMLKIGTNAEFEENFKGSLDDIRIFDYVLSPSQIQALRVESD